MKHLLYHSIAVLTLVLGSSGCIGPLAAARPEIPVVRCIASDEKSGSFLSGKNMLTGFLLIGPFSATGSGSDLAAESLHYPHLRNEREFTGGENLPDTVKYVVIPEDPKAISCDLNAVFPKDGILYALACLESNAERHDLSLHLGSSGYIKVWWNGELVHAYDKSPRTGALDQETADHLTLKKGRNILLVKCVRTGEKWDLFCRFSQGGHPLRLIPAALQTQTGKP